jgi:predicted membrane protein
VGQWLGEVAVDLGAIRFPDTSMSCPVGFMVGVWVMFGVVIGPVFGSSIQVISKLVMRSAALKPP